MENCTERNRGEEAMKLSVAAVALESSLIFLIMLTSMVCNFLVGFAIIRRPEMISWSSNRLLLNLTVANFVLSVSVLPFVFASSLKRSWPFELAWCKINGFITNLLCTASVWTAMFLSIDRYHCIVNSLNYPIIMSPAKTYLFIGFSWALSFFIAILPVVGWGSSYGFKTSVSSCMVGWDSAQSDGYTKFYAFAAFIVPSLVMLWAYYHILKAARRQARVRQIAVLPRSVRASISSTASVFMGSKALWTTFIVLGTLFFLWGPYVIVMLLESSRVSVSRGVEVTAVLLSFSSAAVYPGIYGFRVRAIRKEIKRFMHRRLCGDMNVVRPISPSDTGFVMSSHFRNRSVSDGSLDVPFVDRNAGAASNGLPVINEEVGGGSSNVKTKPTDSTALDFSTEVNTLPGTVMR